MKITIRGGISMKIGAIPENILDRVARASGALPRSLAETHVAMMLARTIMTALQ